MDCEHKGLSSHMQRGTRIPELVLEQRREKLQLVVLCNNRCEFALVLQHLLGKRGQLRCNGFVFGRESLVALE